MINVVELITDPDFAQPFEIHRSNGAFIKGVWTEEEPEIIKVVGIIQPARPRDISQVPEGDRVGGGIVIYTLEPLYVTRTGQYKGISDKVIWRGDYYKISNVSIWGDHGHYMANADRILGA